MSNKADNTSRKVSNEAVSIKLSLDASDVLSGLKAVQREARKTVKSVKEAQEVIDGFSLTVEEAELLLDMKDRLVGAAKIGGSR